MINQYTLLGRQIAAITTLPFSSYSKMTLFFCASFLSSFSISFGQSVPVKEWDKSFGGAKHDEMYTIIQTNDGGYLLGGDSDSPIGGEKSQGTQGLNDFWVVKTDASGNKEWDKRFGGNSKEEMFTLLQTPDNGYILGGWSMSNINGDQTQASRGSSDYWIVKIDENGNKLWDKRYGGPGEDELRSMAPTSDGGFIFAGESTSGIGGEKTGTNRGGYDVWIVKADGDGNLQWEASYGGVLDDRLNAIQQTADGGYIIGSWTISPAGFDVTQSGRGSTDMWLIKTDVNGVKQWDGRYGGNDNEYLYALDQTNDGGFVLGGYTRSNVSGEVTIPGKGGFDFWIVKTDANGVKQWDKRYGGTKDEKGKSIYTTTDGGFIMGGWSESDINEDKTQNTKGSVDYWVMKMDMNGNKLWDLDFGANNEERLHDIPQTSDGGFIIGGHSYSGKGGDKTQPNFGIDDFWIVKLSGTAANDTFYADTDGDGFGNVAADTIALIAPAGFVSNSTDCNDADAAINPDAIEKCNANIDDNCNGLADDSDLTVTGQISYYIDNDLDSFGSGMALHACIQPEGTALENDDCNNNNAAIYPGAVEICNAGVDDNCDGLSDDADPSITGQGTYYTDNDQDAYGTGEIILACVQPAGTAVSAGDCNDGNAAINPGAFDLCNGIDDNCDTVTDENPMAVPIVEPSGTINACTGVEVILTTALSSSLTYQWYRNVTPQEGATNNTFSTTKSGSFLVKVSTIPGCEASSAFTIINRFNFPNAKITALGNLNICETGSVDLQANSGTGLSYQWIKGSKLVDGATNIIYTATAKGNYKVTVTNEAGCSKTSGTTKVTKACKEATPLDVAAEGSMSIYPNPADNHMVIDLKLQQALNEEATIELIDLLGRVVQSTKTMVADGSLQYDLLLNSKIVAGTYLVKVIISDQLLVKTVVVK
ncbi:MAG: T9SS type A sorting domain-containing protein [Chitinophagaceae bacterium]|nr:T9SS type A sorting domain-containing protein [Chitinophagaceae bacterium]